ncbi:MAG: CARDB domain-containing protein [Myxococcota bacterium]
MRLSHLLSIALSLSWAAIGCSKGEATCPDGTKEVAGRCALICHSDEQCVAGETCSGQVCVAGSRDGSSLDSGALDGAEDASVPDADSPDGGAGMDAEDKPDATEGPDLGSPDALGGPDALPGMDAIGPQADGGAMGINLWLSGGTTPPEVLTIRQPAALQLSAHNSGTVDSGSFNVIVYLSPGFVPVASWVGQRIQRNSVVQHTFNLVVPDGTMVGVYDLVAHIDPQNSIAELDETDNLLPLGQVEVESLVATPATVNFGVVSAGCARAGFEISLENRANADVTVARLTAVSGAFTVLTPTPMVVPALGTANVSVEFAPPVTGIYRSTLQIARSGAVHSVDVGLAGEGGNNTSSADYFIQPSQRNADILFIVDDSPATGMAQSLLAAQVQPFLDDLRMRGVDGQVAVTTTDGNLAGTLIGIPSTLNIGDPATGAQLAAAVQVGQGGHGPSAALESGLLALGATPSFGAVHRGAWPGVIFVSATEDISPRMGYFGLYQSLLAPEDELAVGGIVPSGMMGCTPAAMRYLDFVTAAQGTLTPVCGPDFSAVLLGFGGPKFGLVHRYHLHGTPAALPVEVFVNGVQVPNRNLHYDSNTNDVVLDTSVVPLPSSTIEVRYTQLCGA